MKKGTGVIEAGTFETGTFETGTYETDAAIDISAGRSEEFHRQTQALSDCIKTLPLDHEENNDLIDEIIKQIIIGEDDAFKYGFSMGVELGKSLGLDQEGNNQ